jgi:hypothetical protein
MRNVTLTLSVAALAATGCLSSQNSSTIDALNDSVGGKSMPFVEAYIEYAGPQSRWAGPTSFTLHVLAKDAHNAQIAVAPAMFAEPTAAPTMKKRAPASTPGMSGDLAREQIANLALAMQGQEGTFRGCLSPVRVRLIRADGALVEKQGCRGQNQWTRVASQTADRFLTAAIYGIERAPAAVEVKPALSANTTTAKDAPKTTEKPRIPGDKH